MPIFTKKEKKMRNYAIIKTAVFAVLIATVAGCGQKKEEESTKTNKVPAEIKVIKGAVKKSAEKEKSKSNSGQFYYSYNKEKKSEDTRRRTTLDAYLNIRSPYERVMITMMINKLSRDFIVKCSPCHDDYANGVIGPSLLDKNGTFIYESVMAFKNGKKENVLMKQLVSQIDNEKLRKISEEIAVFNKQIQEMRKGRQ
jgi:hypothetical protein